MGEQPNATLGKVIEFIDNAKLLHIYSIKGVGYIGQFIMHKALNTKRLQSKIETIHHKKF